MTPDAQGLAFQLDAMGKKPSADLAAVLDILSGLPSEQVGPALDQLSPAGYDAGSAAARAAARRHIGLIASFIENGIAEDTGPVSLWAAGLNGSADGPQAGSSSRTGGGAGGADYHIGRNIRFGFAFGYSHTAVTQPGSASRGQMDAVNYGSYASWKFAQGYFEAIFSMVEENFSDQRAISFGQLERVAASQHDGRGGSGYLGTGYDFTLAGLRLRPNAALEYGRFQQQAFTETGAGSLDLAVDDQTDDTLQSQVGVRADYDLKLPGIKLTPRAAVKWGHQFNTDPRTLQARFAQGGSEKFTVHGLPGTADGCETSAGFSATFFGVNLYADYILNFAGSSGMGHALQAGLWTRF
jgi:outer membrane autotransporter protein